MRGRRRERGRGREGERERGREKGREGERERGREGGREGGWGRKWERATTDHIGNHKKRQTRTAMDSCYQR